MTNNYSQLSKSIFFKNEGKNVIFFYFKQIHLLFDYITIIISFYILIKNTELVE